MCSILSFIVGFALPGTMTYLPAYLQYVQGVSATASGVRALSLSRRGSRRRRRSPDVLPVR
ncbi:hypothetical protein [Nocardia sp. NPDC004860]|uniref:hypothetical protein n=1 Tax=Nocardia sp. NPDC004860 TaxID=3154557 RepID=UPI0033B2C5A6